MRCHWCKGAGAYRSNQAGQCSACDGTGQLADPPFRADVLNILPAEQVSALAAVWCERDKKNNPSQGWRDFSQAVARVTVGGALSLKPGELYFSLPDAAVNAFLVYWEHPRRHENLGQVIQRIAQYVVDYPDTMKLAVWADTSFLDAALDRLNNMSRDVLMSTLTKHRIPFVDLRA